MAILGRLLLMLTMTLPAGAASAAQLHERPQGETPWVKAFHAEARMIAGRQRERDGKRFLLAGIHVRLDEGWKTYWRNPGDSGLPPNFDWSGSINLKSVRVLWPAPHRFSDPAGTSIGYKQEVVFPVLIEPADTARPVDVAVQFDYAVCKDICAPADAALKLLIAPGGKGRTPHEALLARYLATVPATQKPDSRGPRIADLKIELAGPSPAITVDAVFPGGAPDGDLFVEGPEGVYVPMARRVGKEQGDRVRFAIDLTKGDDPAKLRGKVLTFTLVSPNGQTEMTSSVD